MSPFPVFPNHLYKQISEISSDVDAYIVILSFTGMLVLVSAAVAIMMGLHA